MFEFNRPRRMASKCFVTAIALVLAADASKHAAGQSTGWTKHIIHSGFQTMTAVAADFTGDGLPDVINNSGGKTRLFVAPKWKQIILDDGAGHDCIHSEIMDVDGDGDMDWIGARYQPGLILPGTTEIQRKILLWLHQILEVLAK